MSVPLRRRRAGLTIVETLAAALCATVIGAGVCNVMLAGANTNAYVMDRNTAVADGRQAVDVLADGWRTNAMNGATFEPGLRGAKALTSGAASDITYTDNAGTSIRYWRSGTKLLRQVNGLPSTGEVVKSDLCTASGATPLAFYYLPSGSTNWQTSAATPSSIVAVMFTVTTSVNGMARATTGSVRLRQR